MSGSAVPGRERKNKPKKNSFCGETARRKRAHYQILVLEVLLP